MVVLGIDTSQRVGSVALARGAQLLESERLGEGESHLVEIGGAIDRLLAGHGFHIGDVERVALVAGPGSFTGLRIGMAFAKGLHAGLGIDIATIGSLELLALPHLEGHATVCTMIDAYKQEVYGAVFTRSEASSTGAQAVVAPCAMSASTFMDGLEVAPAVFVGSGVLRYRDAVAAAKAAAGAEYADPLDQSPSAGHLAGIAHRLEALAPERVRSLEPEYIRSSGARLKPLKK